MVQLLIGFSEIRIGHCHPAVVRCLGVATPTTYITHTLLRGTKQSHCKIVELLDCWMVESVKLLIGLGKIRIGYCPFCRC